MDDLLGFQEAILPGRGYALRAGSTNGNAQFSFEPEPTHPAWKWEEKITTGLDSERFLRQIDTEQYLSAGEIGSLGSAELQPQSREAIAAFPPTNSTSPTNADPITGATIADATGPLPPLPLSFIPNVGQADPNINSLVKGANHSIFFTPEEIIFKIESVAEPTLVQLNFPGANPSPSLEYLAPLPGFVNFIAGTDPKEWHTNLPTYQGLVYRDLYEGIDLVYSGREGFLKSDFIVQPGADPEQIRTSYSGVEAIAVRDEYLVLQTASGELIEAPPLVYQEIDGRRVPIQASYAFFDEANNLISETELNPQSSSVRVGFSLGSYNPAFPLVIDPTLEYSTFLGGSGNDRGLDVALDDEGNIYLTGSTTSVDFPVQNALQGSSGEDVFVTKFFRDGTRLFYSTYFGGSGVDSGSGIEVDSEGNVYVTGVTTSADFPTLNAIQSEFNGNPDVFVTKINSNGDAIEYSTYLGGDESESPSNIALDASENVYVAGNTLSTNFPTENALQSRFGGGVDGFVAKINGEDNTLDYSTYLGGSSNDEVLDITADDAENIYLTGTTFSTDFPIENPFQASRGGGNFTNSDAFVTKLNSDGSALEYSTYLGGTDDDRGLGIAVDLEGNAYVTGSTGRIPEQVPIAPDGLPVAVFGNFPTRNPLQETFGSINANFDTDAFVTKFNSDGTDLEYSTYLGGRETDIGEAIATDVFGNAYVVGTTSSSLDFPLENEFQSRFGGGASDVFVTQIDSDGESLEYSTYLGGANSDSADNLVVEENGTVYIAGSTSSIDFPTETAFQGSLGGLTDAFLAKIVPDGLGREINFQNFVQFVTATERDPFSLFYNEGFYLADNPDVAAAVARRDFSNGLEHFIQVGQFERRQPSPLFEEAVYLSQNPDVAAGVAAGTIISGFDHFIRFGFFEGRDRRTELFDERFYLAENPSVANAVASGLYRSGFDHFIQFGQVEGRAPNPFFDEGFYLFSNPDVAPNVAAGIFTSGFDHFARLGELEGRSPSPLYNERFYLENNPDVAGAVAIGRFQTGFEHFLLFGSADGRQGSPFFDEIFYLEENPDIAEAVLAGLLESGFDHFIDVGQFEGRAPSEQYDEAFYLDTNPDVAAAVDSGALASGFEHFLLIGFAEGRPGVGDRENASKFWKAFPASDLKLTKQKYLET